MKTWGVHRTLLQLLLLGLVGGGLNGCVAPRPQNPQQAECLTLFRQLDRATDAAGCGNAAYHRAAGFPWLRSNRFWSAQEETAGADEREFLLAALEQLDAESRAAELACLPPTATIDSEPLAACRTALRPLALADPEKLRQALQVPDDYSLLRRILGFYPMAYPFVARGAANAYAARRDWFGRDLGTFTGQGEWLAHGPETDERLNTDQIAAMLRQSADNPLGIPLPAATALQHLAASYAPVVVQQIAGSADRLGAPAWDGETIKIDPTLPTLYYYADHLLYRGQAHLRLNYVWWYAERSGESTPWIETGNLDGVTLGIVLDSDGSILTAEAMNNCGCYHMFFPGPRLGPQRPFPWSVDPLVPQALPQLVPGERIALYLLSGWHQAVRAGTAATAEQHYRLRPYAELEQLPRSSTTPRSIFSADGVIPQSSRIERLLFFSMGIDNVGAMRQRGHHPITLLGREHYDDPDLLERNFLPR
jgi:hypothetical protein